MIKIHIDKLAEISGFTARWINQLSADGILPPKIDKAHFSRDAAISALFAYLKDSRQRLNAQKEELNDLAIRAKKIELAESEGKYLSKEDVCASIKAIGLGQRGLLHRALVVELPPKLAGLDEIAIRELAKKTVDEICDQFNDRSKPWTK